MKEPGNELLKIDSSKIANPVLRFGAWLSRPVIERALCFKKINRIYSKSVENNDGTSFSCRILKTMNVEWKINAPAQSPIPEKGPVVLVANHPFGGIEGVMLLALLDKFRKDSKVMANYILSVIPELRESIFFVDPFGGEKAHRANLRSMKSCIKWLEEGHVLGVFPAGEVSSIDIKTGKVRDPAWSPTIAKMVRRTNATVVPVFFGGNNGALFNMAGLVHPRLRTLLLPKQLVNKTNRSVTIEIGQPISPKEMEDYPDDEKLTGFLRLRTYILGERASAKNPQPEEQRRECEAAPQQSKIIDPVPPAVLEGEILSLPPSSLLCEGDGLKVYCAESGMVPNVLREIGRLREITYREVGEGTNLEIDLDPYDNYYRHLFLWNGEKKEIAGAYRLGLADEILPKYGVKGLYTHTCFKFTKRLISRIQPSIELGRSFVRKEYQKGYSPLMLLWKGLCLFVAAHPHYKTFFGPVSISNDYMDASRNLILRSLRFSNFEKELAKLVKPRFKPKRAKKSEWTRKDYNEYLDDLEQVSKMVQDIESDRKGIPVLLRQYVKMGGKILAFNVDPAFNYCVDGLIAVNIPAIEGKVLARYMGKENHARYMACHGGKAQG